MFNNELELLRLRLDTLAEVVDRVVLVEARTTYRGRPKPLNFEQAAEDFRPHLPRITHVVADIDQPDCGQPQYRERAQHRAIRDALASAGVGPDDLFLVGDLDEIPSAEAVRALADAPPTRPVRLRLRHAVYFANYELARPWEDGTMAGRGDQLDHPDLGLLLGDPRAVWGLTDEPVVDGGGWHFSYLGGPSRVRLKHEQASDSTFDNEREKAETHVERCVRLGVHHSGRDVLTRVPLEQLDSMQKRLLAVHPQMFNFSPMPTAEAQRFRAFVRLRHRMPLAFARVADRAYGALPGLVGASASLVEGGHDALRRSRARW